MQRNYFLHKYRTRVPTASNCLEPVEHPQMEYVVRLKYTLSALQNTSFGVQWAVWGKFVERNSILLQTSLKIVILYYVSELRH